MIWNDEMKFNENPFARRCMELLLYPYLYMSNIAEKLSGFLQRKELVMKKFWKEFCFEIWCSFDCFPFYILNRSKKIFLAGYLMKRFFALIRIAVTVFSVPNWWCNPPTQDQEIPNLMRTLNRDSMKSCKDKKPI